MDAELERTKWDAVIAGAGPAGAVAAAILAGRGWKVLLVEKSRWPRNKACGGCLSAAAVETLSALGLSGVLRGAERIERTAWRVGKQTLSIGAEGGAAILRAELDAALVAAAMERGCVFLHGAAAALLPGNENSDLREITLQSAGQARTVRASVVLACDGIGGTLLANESWARWNIQAGAWIGAAATLENWTCELPSGTIQMNVGQGGYVGLVRVPQGRVHLAAALDPAACRDCGGPGRMIEGILRGCGQTEWNGLEDAKFFGAGALTRRRETIGGHRVLAVGDACGYVEPFTGQGMAWAIGGAREAVNLLPARCEKWPADLPQQWRRRHVEAVGRRQRWCRAMRPIIHRPAWASLALRIGRAIPPLSELAAAYAGQSRAAAAQGSIG